MQVKNDGVLVHKATVSVPYTDDTGEEVTRNFARFSFSGPTRVDGRVIKRAIRRWAKYQLGRSIRTEEIRFVMKGRVDRWIERA